MTVAKEISRRLSWRGSWQQELNLIDLSPSRTTGIMLMTLPLCYMARLPEWCDEAVASPLDSGRRGTAILAGGTPALAAVGRAFANQSADRDAAVDPGVHKRAHGRLVTPHRAGPETAIGIAKDWNCEISSPTLALARRAQGLGPGTPAGIVTPEPEAA